MGIFVIKVWIVAGKNLLMENIDIGGGGARRTMDNLLSGLIGSLIGGIMTLLGSAYTLKKEHKNQKYLIRLEDLKRERAVFLTLNDELEENNMNIEGYLTYMDANNKDKVDFKKDNINRVNNEAWKQVREMVLLSENEQLVKKISNFYKGMYGFKCTDLIAKDTVEKTYKDCIAIKNEIENYVEKLNCKEGWENGSYNQK